MAANLRGCAAIIDPSRVNILVNDRRAEALAQVVRQTPPSLERLSMRYLFAAELLNAGREDDALTAVRALRTDLPRYLPAGSPQDAQALLLEAMIHMRTAERENCCLLNNRDSCLLPIRGAGVHRRPEGATRAAQTLASLLEAHPGHLGGRWLLNLAHMTLGTYPAGVPEAHRIPPETFAPEEALPRFDNVAGDVGLRILGLAGGASLEDFDNDGWLDLVVSSSGLDDTLRYFRNDGAGGFEERTEAAGLTGLVGGLNLVHADYDNDGFVDVLVLRGGWMGTEGRFPLSLLRNEGGRAFTDVTRAAGLYRLAPTQTAAWLDYDGDGHLDLFVGNESTDGAVHPCQLFRNRGDGTFADVARAAGVDFTGFVKAVVAGDYDGDGRPDLFLSVTGADNVLFRNEGPREGGGWHFTDVAAKAGVTEPRLSFGAAFFDHDNDGWDDLFVVGYQSSPGIDMADSVAADFLGLPTDAERGRLYRNRGDGTFEDVTRAAGLYRVVPGMGLNFGDLDNDGFLDLYIGTGNPELSTLVPNRMFRNVEGRVFRDVTTAGNFGHLQKGHGIAFGDVDNDGDQDVFAQMGGAYVADEAWSALYENPGAGGAHAWVGLELEGTRSNRKAVGARVTVTVEGAQRRSLHRTVGTGGSFGASPLRQHVGLGEARGGVRVEVLWPGGGRSQTFEGLEAGRWYRLTEGGGKAEALARPRTTLRRRTDEPPEGRR